MMRVGGAARHSEYNLQEAGAIFRRDGRGSDCSPGTPRQGLLHENMILDRAKPDLALHVPALGKFRSLMPCWPCASGLPHCRPVSIDEANASARLT